MWQGCVNNQNIAGAVLHTMRPDHLIWLQLHLCIVLTLLFQAGSGSGFSGSHDSVVGNPLAGDSVSGNSLARSCAQQTQRWLYLHEISPPGDVNLWLWLCRYVYVSTVDGRLIALSELGQTLWTHTASLPLFFSSLSYGEVMTCQWNL